MGEIGCRDGWCCDQHRRARATDPGRMAQRLLAGDEGKSIECLRWHRDPGRVDKQLRSQTPLVRAVAETERNERHSAIERADRWNVVVGHDPGKRAPRAKEVREGRVFGMGEPVEVKLVALGVVRWI